MLDGVYFGGDGLGYSGSGVGNQYYGYTFAYEWGGGVRGHQAGATGLVKVGFHRFGQLPMSILP